MDTMAKVEISMIPVLNEGFHHGVWCLSSKLLEPNEYDKVKAVPKVLSFEGRIYSFTGWNSDTGNCYYRTGFVVAEVVK